MAKVVMVTRRTMRQREIRVTMTDGKFGKNEVEVHDTGLEPNFDINKTVKEACDALSVMQERNPLYVGITSKTNRLPAEKELPP